MEPSEELKAYIEAEIIPRYGAFDAAHRTDHVRTVIAQSLVLAGHYEVDADMVYAIAAYHDTGLAYGRESHHIRSGEILLGDSFMRQRFTEEQMAVMRDAIEDHRASSDHAPRTIYGRIVAEADRCIDPETVIRRTIQYGLAHYPCAQPRGVVRPLRGTPATEICRRRLPAALDTRIGQRPQTGGTACADSRHGTAARSLRADLRRDIPELIPGDGIPYYDSGNSRHRVRNPHL